MSRIVGKYNLITLNDLNTFINSGIIQLDSINKKGTKIPDKSKYMYFLEILKKKLYIEEDDYIIPFFAEKNIYIPKIIINGYIEHQLNSEENKMVISLINKIFPLIMNKKYFVYIYKKLSKIFRRINTLNNDETLIPKFLNIFDIWKLFYTYNDDLKLSEKYISFYGNNCINVKIPNVCKNHVHTELVIHFIKSPLFTILNKTKKEFSFIKLYKLDNKGNKEELLKLKYDDIIQMNSDKEKKYKNNICKIKITIYETKIVYEINDDEEKKEIKNIGNNIDKFNKLKILSNFSGKISLIEILRIYKNENITKIDITPGKEKLNYILNPHHVKKEKEKGNANNNDENEAFDIKIKNNNKKSVFYKYYPEILYDDIEYYGGLECFIPILKIFQKLLSKEILIDNKLINSNYSNKIKDSYKNFFKVMINTIYCSEKNLLNFFKIIVPLIGAISEINDSLDVNIKKEIYKDCYFYYLYILIMISPSPMSVKKIFQNIIGINDINKHNFIFTDFKNSQKILMRYNSLCWYSFTLFIYIEFIILTTNDIEKVPKGIFSLLLNIYNSLSNNIKIVRNLEEIKKSKIMLMIKILIGIINNFYPKQFEIPEGFLKINEYDLSNLINSLTDYKEYFIHLFCFMMKIYFYLNNMNLICFENNGKNKNEECSYSKFYTLFLSLKDVFIIKDSDNESSINQKIKLKNKFKELLCEFSDHKPLILEVLNESKEMNFIKKEEKIMWDFIDYHKQYRHLMKELFIFNRPWSNQKLFFTNNHKVKYKNINYYTNNFQRPIIYPVLDYQKQCPKFSYYKIDNNFYINDEDENIKDIDNININKNEEEYNFNLKTLELNRLNNANNEELIKKIKKEYIQNIQVYNVCLIKRTHHIKGLLFMLTINGILDRIYFYSFSQKENKDLPSCNNTECNKQKLEFHHYNDNKHLCYGAFFPCPFKDSNIIICIKLSEVRLIMRRIYFYRKSGIEFFTNTKSYFLNFSENPLMENYRKGMAENNCDILINLLVYYSQDKFYPINVNDQIIGYSKILNNSFDKNEKDLIFIKNKYINELINNWIKIDKKNTLEKGISSFDALIYLNLLSNRSYNDLYQYPVFPLLFYYSKNDEEEEENNNNYNNFNIIERDLSLHIGFQTNSKLGEKRKKKIISIFESSKDEVENGLIQYDNAYYFESNFSNGNYACNYLLRIFPYSFIAIEIQGDGFDDPKKLFNSIEETFYNISSQENNFRELLPEFFYFPEMFLNINKINFNKNNDIIVNDVKMPNEFIKPVLDEDNNINDNINDNILEEKSNFYFYCKFVEKIKNDLEKRFLDVYKWSNLIFGENQKYNYTDKNGQLFKTETYIDFNKDKGEKFNNYLKNDEIMNSVEFGLLPVQTIFNKLDLKQIQMNSIDISDFINDIKEKIIINKNKILNINSNNNNFIPKGIIKINIEKNYYYLNIDTYYSKIEIFINEKLKYEFYENIDSIIYVDYNKRLNMYIISSIDGYLCLYILPGKLISAIKHPIKNHYFNYVLLSSNPFPSIIAFDKTSNTFYSYSINGIFIHKKGLFEILELKEDDDNVHICPIFDVDNGIHKDYLLIQVNKSPNLNINKLELNNSLILISIPFFEKIESFDV